MDSKEWLDNVPAVFPNLYSDTPPNHNPVIGETQFETILNVKNITQLIQEIMLAFATGGLVLSKAPTHGLCCMLSCLYQALEFEETYRPDSHQGPVNLKIK